MNLVFSNFVKRAKVGLHLITVLYVMPIFSFSTTNYQDSSQGVQKKTFTVVPLVVLVKITHLFGYWVKVGFYLACYLYS